jgi:predicted transcriptional regulator
MADATTIPPDGDDSLELTTMVVAAYLRNNEVQLDQLPDIIRTIHQAITANEPDAGEPALPEPPVPIKKSVMPDYIVCLEDGKRLKMLKRHLRTTYGLTPDAYRRKWNLPADYPMVAPNYAAQRSKFAKQIGLGHRDEETAAARAKK